MIFKGIKGKRSQLIVEAGGQIFAHLSIACRLADFSPSSLGFCPTHMRVCLCSHLVMSDSFVTSWTVAHQAPLSMEFSRQEYWSGLPSSPLGHLPNPRMKPVSPASPALSGGLFPTEPPGKPPAHVVHLKLDVLLPKWSTWKFAKGKLGVEGLSLTT